MKTKKHLSFIVIIALLSIPIYGQSYQKNFQKIDSLFTSWNKVNHPGGVVSIIKNSSIIFSRAYGLASIEYQTPNTINTLFNIGSISKQFTAMGIVLLEQEGKLSLEDDIRKYLPEFPDFGEKITIRHLLHHTSGLRDLHGLLGLAGWRSKDLETNDDVYRIIKNQKELNFRPGEEFLYCNTGYILLANIIEKSSNSSFRDWMKVHIFEPLGLKNTYVEDQYDSVASNNASSYYSNQKFKRAIDYWGYFGSGNIHSNANDLILWSQNFIAPPKKWDLAFKKLLTLAPLTNGIGTNYAFGVRVEKHQQRKIIQHGGAVGGYRSILRTYPQDEISIVILSNFSGSDILPKIDKTSEIILENQNTSKEVDEIPFLHRKHYKLSRKQLSKYEGIYWNPREKYGRKI